MAGNEQVYTITGFPMQYYTTKFMKIDRTGTENVISGPRPEYFYQAKIGQDWTELSNYCKIWLVYP